MLALVLHPSETRRPRHQVRASARRIIDSNLLTLRFEIEGASFVNCPAASMTASRRDGLWKATCFECFYAGPSSSYCEWNFAPNGDWAAYSFESYRNEMKNLDVDTPSIERTSVGDRARFEIELSVDKHISAGVLNLSLTAVVLEKNVDRPFFWALVHSGTKADFHLRESFTLELGY